VHVRVTGRRRILSLYMAQCASPHKTTLVSAYRPPGSGPATFPSQALCSNARIGSASHQRTFSPGRFWVPLSSAVAMAEVSQRHPSTPEREPFTNPTPCFSAASGALLLAWASSVGLCVTTHDQEAPRLRKVSTAAGHPRAEGQSCGHGTAARLWQGQVTCCSSLCSSDSSSST
jgi:hypothetical protein